MEASVNMNCVDLLRQIVSQCDKSDPNVKRVFSYLKKDKVIPFSEWLVLAPEELKDDLLNYEIEIDNKLKEEIEKSGIGLITGDKQFVYVYTPGYSKYLIDNLKTLGGTAKYRNGMYVCWTFEKSKDIINILGSLFPTWRNRYSYETISQLELNKRLKEFFVYYENGKFYGTGTGGVYRKYLFRHGFTWDKKSLRWTTPACFEYAVNWLTYWNWGGVTFDLSFEDEYVRLLDRHFKSIDVLNEAYELAQTELFQNEFVEFNFFQDDFKKLKLREFQVESLHWKFQRKFHLDAHDMGLGKTFMNAFMAKCIQDINPEYRVVIVCPSSVKGNWESTVGTVGLRNTTVHSWGLTPTEVKEPFILIGDESHKTQDPSSQQTQKFLNLSFQADFVFLLSGTPIKNGRCSNVYCQLLALRVHEALLGEEHFFQRYNESVYAMNRLKNRYTDKVILFKDKKDCVDLPPLERVFVDVEFTPEQQAVYNTEFNLFMEKYGERVLKGICSGEAENLVAALGMRKANSIGKIPDAASLAQEIVETGNQVVVFAEFLETIEGVKRLLEKSGVKVAYLSSNLSSGERQSLIDEFWNGSYQAFLTTTKTGGVGVQLQCASYVILVDRPWTPGDTFQGEDRLNRIGQKNPVTSYWLVHGIDKHVDNVLCEKQTNINDMLGSSKQF